MNISRFDINFPYATSIIPEVTVNQLVAIPWPSRAIARAVSIFRDWQITANILAGLAFHEVHPGSRDTVDFLALEFGQIAQHSYRLALWFGGQSHHLMQL
jgi:hypothetical protein